jgi:hypothetical protein
MWRYDTPIVTKVGTRVKRTQDDTMKKRKKKTAKTPAKPEPQPATVDNPPKTSTARIPGNSW